MFSVQGRSLPRSHLTGFGLWMMGQPTRLQPTRPGNVRVFRRLALTIGLFAGLAPAVTHAQTNIDQGKSPAEIFANDCAACHKGARGLANGKSSATLAGFLREHYTASNEQASALAAYVMGAGGGDSVPATQGRGPPKPPPDHGRAAVEEPKPPVHPGKPDAGAPPSAKLRPPDDGVKPGDVPSIMAEPGAAAPDRRPAAGRHDVVPVTANRGRRKELEPTVPGQQPAAVVAEPAPPAAPARDTSPAAAPGPSAAAPASSDSGEPVPRDNIPD
jgi:hypothetical protein